jgi:hypothetical protein
VAAGVLHPAPLLALAVGINPKEKSMSIFNPTFSIGERIAAFVSGKLRHDSKPEKRYRKMVENITAASTSFPNNDGGYVRHPKAEIEKIAPVTLEQLFRELNQYYAEPRWPQPSGRKPTRGRKHPRNRIVGMRVNGNVYQFAGPRKTVAA